MASILLKILLTFVLLTLVDPRAGSAQTSDEVKALTREIETLKQGQATIQRQLQEITNLLRASRPAAPTAAAENVLLSVEAAPSQGNKDAPVTLVEFADFQCPFCARHFRDTFPELDREYIRTGKVKYVFRDLPIESIHPGVSKAHEAAHCAADQGKYWEMHHRLFANNKSFRAAELLDHGKALGLELTSFEQCLNGAKHASTVSRNLLEGQQAGVQGTPTFFLGRTDPKGLTIKTSRRIVGAQPYANFKQAIDALLPESR